MSPREGASAPLSAIRTVLDYLWRDERCHYIGLPPEERGEDHIFPRLRRIHEWLEAKGEDLLGDCPRCGANDGYMNVGREHWGVCHRHRAKWLRGENLFRSWREQSPEDWRANQDQLDHYDVVQPTVATKAVARGGKRRDHRQSLPHSLNVPPITRVYFVYKFWVDVPANGEGEDYNLAQDTQLRWDHSIELLSYVESDCIDLGLLAALL